MKQANKIWELYASNIISAIQEIVNSPQIDSIIHTHFPHVYAKINQFEQTYSDPDLRRWYLEKLLVFISDSEALILDGEDIIKEPRLELLKEIKTYLKKTFKDLKFSERLITAPEKIILFEYLGVLDLLRKKNINETALAGLLSTLWGGSSHNLEKFIREINLPPGKGHVKNSKSLNTVKQVIEQFKLISVSQRVDEDLNLLKKKK